MKTYCVVYRDQHTGVKVDPLMLVQNLLDAVEHVETEDGYRCIVHNRVILSRSTIVAGDTYVDGEIFRLVVRKPYISYCRLSTGKQNDLYSFTHQREMIKSYILPLKGVVVESYQEIATGRQMDSKTRPIFDHVVKRCQDTGYTLVVSKTDRLCRNTASIIDLDRLNIRYEIAELGVDQSRFMLMITASVAEEESRLISDRTRKAMREMGRSKKPAAKPVAKPTASRPVGRPKSDPVQKRREFLEKHRECIKVCHEYKKSNPSASLMEVQRNLTLKQPSGEAYTYDTLYRIFGKNWVKNPIEQAPKPSICDFLDRFYQTFADENYQTVDHARIPIHDSEYTNCDRSSDVWENLMKREPIIWVRKLSDVPVCEGVYNQLKHTGLVADDYPTVYYKIAYMYLLSESKILSRVPKKISVFRRQDRAILDILHVYKENGIPVSKMAANTGLSSTKCSLLLSTSMNKEDDERVSEILRKIGSK